MMLHISFDGDHIGRMVGRARLADDEEAVRKISAAIERGNEIWKSFCLRHGGSIISAGGDEGSVTVPVDALEELPAIREQYATAVNATVSVGVGLKLSHADKSLIAAKLRGGNCIVFFTEEVDQIVEEAREKGEKTEEAKISEEYLNKATTAMNPGAFEGTHRPSPPAIDKPELGQGDHEEGQVLYDLLDEDRPAPPEQTHAGSDLERQLHKEAWKGEEQDMAEASQAQSGMERVKADLVGALQQLKAQGPVLEQVKNVAPAAHKAMMTLVQAVIAMARQLNPPQPMAKAEGQDKLSQMVDGVRNAHSGDSRGVFDPEHCQKGSCYEQVEGLHHLLGGDESGFAPHHLYHGTFGPHWFLKDQQGRILDPMADTHPEPLPYDRGVPSRFLTPAPSAGAQAVIDKVLAQQAQPELAKEELEKGKLPAPSSPTYHNVVLPVGSTVNQKIKTQHADGSTSWHQVEAGQVLAQDRDGVGGGVAGHAVSSRAPNAK